MMFLTIMALAQLAVIIPLLVMVIRERWAWLLSAAFVVNEASLLYFWAAPCIGQAPLSAGYLFWAGPVSTLVCGVVLNWTLPPLPTRLARVCHPQGLVLAYLAICFLWIPFVLFGFFVGEWFTLKGYISGFQHVASMVQAFLAWLGFTLLFIYLYRAALRGRRTFPDLWRWWMRGMGHDESLGCEWDSSAHIHKK